MREDLVHIAHIDHFATFCAGQEMLSVVPGLARRLLADGVVDRGFHSR